MNARPGLALRFARSQRCETDPVDDGWGMLAAFGEIMSVMSSYKLIAALGSSFAAGPGIDPIENLPAMRSSKNYAHQVAELLGASLVDLTVSGATTANVIDMPQQFVLGGGEFPPQLDGLPAETDMVTITVGGNDLQFAAAMLYAAIKQEAPEEPFAAMMKGRFANGIPVMTNAAIANATDGLIRVIEATRAKAPVVRVVLVDYLTVLEEATSTAQTTPFSTDELSQLLPIQAAVRRIFIDAATAMGTDLLRASDLGAEHALGSADPWVQPFSSSQDRILGSFHPNLAGMTAIAVALAALLADQ
ncbi:MAG: SGNH/GDSL hydrolase family protein [Antricoccus sp.]